MNRLIKLLFIGLLSLVVLNGCISSNLVNIKKENKIKYDNKNHIIGDKNNKIHTLIYFKTINDKVDTKITFFIDKFPYDERFNLCSDIKFDNNINCEGHIVLDKFQNTAHGSWKYKKLKGYKIVNNKKHELLVEHYPSLIQIDNKQTVIDYDKNITTKIFWIYK